MAEKIKAFTYNAIQVLFVCIFIYVFGLNMLVVFQNGRFLSIIFCVLLIILSIFFFLHWKKGNSNYRIINIILIISAFVVLLFLGYMTRVSLHWDYGELIRSSMQVAEGKRGSFSYFARYPNNIPLLLVESLFFKLIFLIKPGATIGQIRGLTIFINSILVFISLFFLNWFIKKILGEKHYFLSKIITIFFCPLYLYTAIFYTDTIALFFLVISMVYYYFYNNASNKNKVVLWLFLLLLMIAIGFKFKATIIFLLIALFIEFFYEKKWKEIFTSILLVVLIIFSFNYIVGNIYIISKEEKEKYQFPYTHWVMMSLNLKYSGGYNPDDVNYTAGYNTFASKKEANMNRIKEILRDNDSFKIASHIFYKKNKRTWTDPTFSTSDYLSRDPIDKNIITQFVTLNGKYYNIYIIYVTSIYLFLIFGTVLSGFFNKIKTNKYVFISQLMLIGLFLFELVWECNPRYVYSYLPFLVITACFGYGNLADIIKEKSIRRSKI